MKSDFQTTIIVFGALAVYITLGFLIADHAGCNPRTCIKPCADYCAGANAKVHHCSPSECWCENITVFKADPK